jgi:hypothetical protein
MIRRFHILLIFTFCSSFLYAQVEDGSFIVTEYEIPSSYTQGSLPEIPDSVWNHKSDYFPIQLYNQHDLPNCGQASGIYNCLSYMTNRAYDREATINNAFAPNYTFNFLNEGYGWFGVSTFDAWNIVKSQGNPIVSDFSEQTFVSHEAPNNFRGTEWMNGYDLYYNSMHYRIENYYSLDVKSEEDLNLLKHFLYNDFGTEESGSTAIFYSDNAFFYEEDNYTYDDPLFAFPFINTKVYTDISGDPTHSMTIAGYTENRLVDFNGDGYITDTIDINEDGVINHHDNETCLWIIINSYGKWWSRDKFLVKYDAICDVWNSQVYFPKPKVNYEPELTFKIKLKHQSRNSIKISAGIASNIDAGYPEYIIDFPIFNYQGGLNNLSGNDTIDRPDELEFGIDISDIKQFVNEYGEYKLFLIIDNATNLSGDLLYASIFDYSEDIPQEFLLCNDTCTIPQFSTNFYHNYLYLDSDWDESNLYINKFDDRIVLKKHETGSSFQIPVSGGSGNYNFEILDTLEYIQELSYQDFDDEGITNYSNQDYRVIYPQKPITFAGRTFDSVAINAPGIISFNFNEYIYPDLYPYQYNPSSFYEDMQIDVFSAYRYTKNVVSAYIDTDNGFKIWFRGLHMAEYQASIEFLNTGEIMMTYVDRFHQTKRSSGLTTNSRKYYCELLPSGIMSEYNTVTYVPVSTTELFSIDNFGNLTCKSSTPYGNYEICIIIKDSEGNKLQERLNISVIDEQFIESMYPNPTLDLINFELNTQESSNAIVEIFKSNGQYVTSFQQYLNAGFNTIIFSAKSHNLSAGTYICRISTDSTSESTSFIVNR